METVSTLPAFQAHFTSVTWIARVMPVDSVVMRHAVLCAVRPKPPRIANLDSIVGTLVLEFYE